MSTYSSNISQVALIHYPRSCGGSVYDKTQSLYLRDLESIEKRSSDSKL